MDDCLICAGCQRECPHHQIIQRGKEDPPFCLKCHLTVLLGKMEHVHKLAGDAHQMAAQAMPETPMPGALAIATTMTDRVQELEFHLSEREATIELLKAQLELKEKERQMSIEEFFNHYAQQCHSASRNAGWWEQRQIEPQLERKLLLIHSEVSEATEALRIGNPL